VANKEKIPARSSDKKKAIAQKYTLSVFADIKNMR